jgi:hypothetical protein
MNPTACSFSLHPFSSHNDTPRLRCTTFHSIETQRPINHDNVQSRQTQHNTIRKTRSTRQSKGPFGLVSVYPAFVVLLTSYLTMRFLLIIQRQIRVIRKFDNGVSHCALPLARGTTLKLATSQGLFGVGIRRVLHDRPCSVTATISSQAVTPKPTSAT